MIYIKPANRGGIINFVIAREDMNTRRKSPKDLRRFDCDAETNYAFVQGCQLHSSSINSLLFYTADKICIYMVNKHCKQVYLT